MSSDSPASDSATAIAAFNSLPRRIFLDSCIVQALGEYGSFLSEEEPLAECDRMHQVADGVANLEALRDIMLVNERAQFEWIVSANSATEARAKNGNSTVVRRTSNLCPQSMGSDSIDCN